MIYLGPLAPPRFLIVRGIDSFSEVRNVRDVAELLRNSAPVCDRWRSIVGVQALGFVESRSDSTTKNAQPRWTAPSLKRRHHRTPSECQLLTLTVLCASFVESARACSPAC